VKLAQELSKRDTGRTLYILDEPTTGLHFADIDLLLKVLHQLRDAGNTIVVIEHNLDVIKTADWLIDMGPEGGAGGGTVVGVGTPEEVAANPASHTGRYLEQQDPRHPGPERAGRPTAGAVGVRVPSLPIWPTRLAS
jgi:excinuclease ABC subunit A